MTTGKAKRANEPHGSRKEGASAKVGLLGRALDWPIEHPVPGVAGIMVVLLVCGYVLGFGSAVAGDHAGWWKVTPRPACSCCCTTCKTVP
jgi:hypothetical protein